MGIGFETPAWLLGAALVAPLVWLYLHQRPRPPAIVSSLRIWRHVPSPATPPRRRPKLPPLFFVQAALILASSLALAGPYRKEPRPPGPPRDAVLVIDVSASMQARESGATRFEQALESARRRADELATEGRRITVVRASQQPEVAGTGLGAAEAREVLDELEVLDVPANLTAAIELAATLAGKEGSIDVFTDAADGEIVMSRDAREATSVHTFARGGENVAITDVRVQTNPFPGETAARILVTVRNYAAEPREVGLDVVPLDPQAEPAAGEEKPTDGPEAAPGGADDAGEDAARPDEGDGTFVVEAGGRHLESMEGIPWSGAFEIRLRGEDDLPLDDVVYGWVPVSRPVDVLLVTDDSSLARRLSWLAERTGSFALRTVGPSRYDPQEAGEVTLFDRFVPKLPPPSNVAYLAPESGNADVTVLELAGEARVAETREHPLLGGVASAGALLDRSKVGLAPGALRPVLLGRSEGREIALIQAGEMGGRRIVATAFRLDPDELRDADDLPSLIFFLNALSFLTPESPGAPLLRTTGERLRAGSGWTAPIESLEGEGGSRPLEPGSDPTLTKAGVYRAASREGTRRVLVSFVDAAESDIRRSTPAATAGEVPAPALPVETAPAEGQPVGAEFEAVPWVAPILAVLAALLLGEWLVLAASAPGRRRASGRGAS